MRTVKFVILISICLFFLMSINAFSQDKPTIPELSPPMDLALLNLEIIKTEVVNEITGSLTGVYDNKLTLDKETKEGHKIVVVTLKGTANTACHITIATNGFTAVYKEALTKSQKDMYDMIAARHKEEKDKFNIPKGNFAVKSSEIITTSDDWALGFKGKHFILNQYKKNPGLY